VYSRLCVVLVCVLSLALPQAGVSAPRDDKTGVLRALALRVGKVLGAASACPNIARSRIKGISDKITDVIKSSSSSEEDSRSAVDLFNASLAEGSRSINARQADCAEADRELADLENASAPAPAAQASQPAQTSIMASAAQQSAAFATQVAGGAVRGVSDSEIRFGASVPLTGPNKDYGHQIKVGVETAFRQTNDAGGVNGRMLRFIVADDGYEPTRTADTMKQLYEREQVFGFVGNFGTATAAVSAPFALEHQMLFYAGYTGGAVLRRDPPDRYVFNYRASYAEETEAAVRYLVKVRRLKPEQIAVFAQQDGFGDAGFAGVAKAMRALRGDSGFLLRMGYQRNTLDIDPAVAQLKANKTPIKAVVMVATYRAAAKFIEKTRDAYPGLIYTNPSAVGGYSLRDELMLVGGRFAEGVIVTQVTPAVDGYSSLILEYKTALAKYFGGEAPDYVSLEYYVAARILIEALNRAGPQLTTEKLVDALENTRDLDLGLGAMVNFSRSEHQGLHKVWGTQLTETGKFEPFDLQ
jgi:branched-chain amino acid transport system substrate-binding protein